MHLRASVVVPGQLFTHVKPGGMSVHVCQLPILHPRSSDVSVGTELSFLQQWWKVKIYHNWQQIGRRSA